MSLYFLDSSAVVKRYVSESGSSWIINLHKPSAQNVVYIAQITGVEVVSAISRRLRGNKLTQKSADKSIFRFVSADNALNAAAQAEGLTVDNPNNYP